jgi:hypothetical protein
MNLGLLMQHVRASGRNPWFDKNIREVLFSVPNLTKLQSSARVNPRQALRSDLDCEFPPNISAMLD